MRRAQLVLVVLLTALVGAATTGCERRVVGETYEGQRAGGRSLQVTDESPPRGATIPGAPAEPPPSTRVGTVAETDPTTRALLAGSGARIVLHDAPRLHPVAPVLAPVTAPTPAAPAADARP